MSTSSSIQVYGLDNVVKMYEKRNCNAWAICAGRQFLFPYIGTGKEDSADALEQYLEMLEQGNKNIHYTLKVYEDISGKITDKTPCDGSFNFKLKEEDTTPLYGGGRLEQRLAGIEAKLSGGGSNEEESTIGKVGEYIENNEWAQKAIMQIAGHFLKIPGLVLPDQNQPAAAQQLAGAPDEQDAKIQQALAVLKTKVPNLGDVLLKLAGMPDANLAFMVSTLNQL